MQKLTQLTLIFVLMLVPIFSLAAVTSPLELLDNTAQQMLEALKTNKASLQRNPDSVYSIVERILLPHVDQETMARSALDREVWESSSATQHNDFIKQYTFLLVRTYSRALASYNDQQVKFLPIRGGYEDKKFIEVNSQIIQKDGPSIPVNYRLRLVGDEWQIYDISVDSISMVQSYKAQFAEAITQGGLQGLIDSLTELNKTKK
jgi:phospholipid transport system substrate-binding protein